MQVSVELISFEPISAEFGLLKIGSMEPALRRLTSLRLILVEPISVKPISAKQTLTEQTLMELISKDQIYLAHLGLLKNKLLTRSAMLLQSFHLSRRKKIEAFHYQVPLID